MNLISFRGVSTPARRPMANSGVTAKHAAAARFASSAPAQNLDLLEKAQKLVHYLQNGQSSAQDTFSHYVSMAAYNLHPCLKVVDEAGTSAVGETQFKKVSVGQPKIGVNGEIVVSCHIDKGRQPNVVKDPNIPAQEIIVKDISNNRVTLQKPGTEQIQLIPIPYELNREL